MNRYLAGKELKPQMALQMHCVARLITSQLLHSFVIWYVQRFILLRVYHHFTSY